ncbi:hypothetical protein YT1_4848 [Rhodococcus ruber]|nr:hypothetical protein YT1_4848 [Rhodococcus ruber]
MRTEVSSAVAVYRYEFGSVIRCSSGPHFALSAGAARYGTDAITRVPEPSPGKPAAGD